MTSDDIESPCTKVCVIDEASGLCRGCRRTLTEVSCWMSYTRAEKLAVLEQIAQRKARRLRRRTLSPIIRNRS